MKITLAAISTRPTGKSAHAEALTQDFVGRARRFVPVEIQTFSSETQFLEYLDKQQSRTPTQIVLLDSMGQLLTSESFAQHVGRLRDAGMQRLVLALGPADGWSEAARARAHLMFSLGRITLPHELARVVMAEQLYRALTILAGHPYHTGH